jgi:TolB-like protein/Flp pilus assembly protein TadD
MKAFAKELKRRRAYQVAIGYGAAAWAILQLVALLVPVFDWPAWTLKLVIWVLLIGLSVVLLIGFVRDLYATRKSGARGHHLAVLAVSLLPALIVAAGFLVLQRSTKNPPAKDAPADFLDAAMPIPQKSVAVLPFESFSNEKNNTYFADGIQDDILNALSKVSDLKVTSRTSAMQYRAAPRNVREIAKALGVANVLEGSVRVEKNRVRVTAQLINALTDAHIWAEQYDRDLADVFAIQSELAESIVAHLKAKLSPTERAAIDSQPTHDITAFDLFLQAKELINNFQQKPDWSEALLKAVRLLDEAIARDGNFALAYCSLTRAHDILYWFDIDHTQTRLAQAKASAEKAIELAPDLGEAHLARALVYYHGGRDYERARAELAVARRTLPNSAEVFAATAWIDRRQGRWDDAIKNLKRAVELDPQNAGIITDLTVLYDMLRRYDDEIAVADRARLANPSSANYFALLKAQVELEKGDTKEAKAVLDSLPPDYDPDGATTTTRLNLALYERDFARATKLLNAYSGEELVGIGGAPFPRSWFVALIARAQNDGEKAHKAFSIARTRIEVKAHSQPENASTVSALGLIDAGLGRKSDAIAEGRRAVEMIPLSADAVDGPVFMTNLAMIYTWSDEVDSAIEQLLVLAKTPGAPADYGQLRLDPAWDAVRGDARFTAMLDRLKP